VKVRLKALLLAVHRATQELGRAPYSAEVAPLLGGSDRRSTRRRLCRARDAGMVSFAAVPRAMHAQAVRLTPEAKVELCLPVVALLAWPVGVEDRGEAAEYGRDAVTVLRGKGVIGVSPFLDGRTRWEEGVQAAAQIAPACDGVIVMHDPTLMGRADVHAARLARLRCVVVDSLTLHRTPPGALWLPPLLQPDLPDIHTRVR
jgi:hypothetical protein